MSENFSGLSPANTANPFLLPNLSQLVSAGPVSVLQSPATLLANNPRAVASSTLTFSTNPTDADVLTVTLTNSVFPGGSLAVSFTASSDTITTAAAKLAAALTSNLTAMGYQIYGTSLAAVLTVHELGPVGNFTKVSFQSTGATTAVLSNQASSTAILGGSATETDVVTIRFSNATFSGGHEDVSFTVPATPTLGEVAAGLNAAINADVVLIANTISSSVSTDTLTISQKGPNFATMSYTQGENSETIAFASLTGQLQGGSGPVYAGSQFTLVLGPNNVLQLRPYQPILLDPTVLAVAVNNGANLI